MRPHRIPSYCWGGDVNITEYWQRYQEPRGPALADGGTPRNSRANALEGRDRERIEQALQSSRRIQQTFIGTGEDVTSDEGPKGLAGRIIEHAGGHLGKYNPPVSLSTHVINTVLVGLNAYVYDTVVRADEETDSDQALLLMAALALHDANKYVEQAYETTLDTSNNSTEVLEYYFDQGDAFGIREVVPGETEEEINQDLTDVKWLVQRTEAKEDAADTRGESTRRVRGLERYCRIGDGFVSKVGRDGLGAGVEWLEKWYPRDAGEHVHYHRFTNLEQPILTNHILAVVKAVIGEDEILRSVETGTDPHGVLLGTTSNAVAYLGAPIDRSELRSTVKATLMEHITERHDFDCKTEWRSFDPDILTEIDIGLEAKRAIIAEGYAETLQRGSGTDHEFESIPDSYREAYLPELAYLVFETQEFEEAFDGLSELPWLREQVRESDEYNNQTWKIGFLAELLRRYRGAVDDGYDPETLDQELQTVRERVQPALAEALAPEADAGAAAVERFFEGAGAEPEDLPGSDAMCFLCGRPATTEFKKGNDAFYGTNKFSRRVPPEGQYKRICPVCNLEHALLKHDCETRGNPVGDETEIAYVYYDDFLAGISIGQHVVYDFMDDDGGYDVSDPDLLADSLLPQFHLQPFYAPDQNGRLAAVRTILDDLVSRGLKVVIGKPFTTFRPEAALLSDLSPGRRQVAFGADQIRKQDDRGRVLALFTLLGLVAGQSDTLDQSNAYISVPDDRFHTLAALVVQHTDWYSDVRAQAHDYFTNHTNDHGYMLMQDVAHDGLDLYGEQYDSPHKKTKIFREAIDATLDGLSRDKNEEELREHVAGQVYKAAKTEKFAPRTSPEKAEAFVHRLFAFLEEEGSFDKATLSRRRNALTNTYLFAYDQLLNERRRERKQEA